MVAREPKIWLKISIAYFVRFRKNRFSIIPRIVNSPKYSQTVTYHVHEKKKIQNPNPNQFRKNRMAIIPRIHLSRVETFVKHSMGKADESTRTEKVNPCKFVGAGIPGLVGYAKRGSKLANGWIANRSVHWISWLVYGSSWLLRSSNDRLMKRSPGRFNDFSMDC